MHAEKANIHACFNWHMVITVYAGVAKERLTVHERKLRSTLDPNFMASGVLIRGLDVQSVDAAYKLGFRLTPPLPPQKKTEQKIVFLSYSRSMAASHY